MKKGLEKVEVERGGGTGSRRMRCVMMRYDEELPPLIDINADIFIQLF